jgi:hypothetical protein
MAHIGDDAELFALGALDDVTARRVELHILECPECLARVNEALIAAAALAEALPATSPSAELGRRLSAAAEEFDVSHRQSTGWFSNRVLRYAVAAALVLALLNAGWQSFRLHREIATEDVALATLVHSHFNHVSMTPLSSARLSAKVLYARDGKWLYVIADRPNGALRVLGYGAATSAESGAALDLGMMASDGQTATLLARPRSRVRRIVLERGNVPIAEATLAY